LSGGLFRHDGFRKLFARRLRRCLPGIVLQAPGDELSGVLLEARRLARPKEDRKQ
jgi:hypothetical protein